MIDDLDLDAIEAAYRGHGPGHSVNKLIRALREAMARHGNDERRLHNAMDAIDELHAEIARLRAAVKRDSLGEYVDAPKVPHER